MLSFEPQSILLCILDGWGIAPPTPGNGLSQAQTPRWDALLKTCPHSQLEASEACVGLPSGQMGNSEVGHMTIGAGQVIMQDLPRIDKSLAEGTLSLNPLFINFIRRLQETGGVCHLLGLLSPGGVHAHQSHLGGIVSLLKEHHIPFCVHGFLDGRDTPPQSARDFIKEFTAQTGVSLSTLGGRYFAMDRDQRWERIEKAYQTLVFGKGLRTADPLALLASVYQAGGGDEFVLPHCVGDYQGMKDGDGLFMLNFRADRIRQLSSALLLPAFAAFDRQKPVSFTATLAMGDYGQELNPYLLALFPKNSPATPLGAIVAEAGLRQLRIAETEKYAHVTFFFNGGRDDPFPGEDRLIIPSPNVATYDLEPGMSAKALTDAVIRALSSRSYNLIVLNYANADMVGHTGVRDAIIEAVETLDACLGRLEEATREAGYCLLITADHGNAEQMRDDTTGTAHTAHTCNPVPLVLANGPAGVTHLDNGQLSDLAPTVLTLLGLPVPAAMTGKSLLGGVNHENA